MWAHQRMGLLTPSTAFPRAIRTFRKPEQHPIEDHLDLRDGDGPDERVDAEDDLTEGIHDRYASEVDLSRTLTANSE